MSARILGVIAAIGLVLATPARAEQGIGDIVDRILYPDETPAAAPQPPPLAAPVIAPAPAPVALAPPPAPGMAPPAGATAMIPSAPANFAPGGGDIIDRAQPAAAATSPMPFSAASMLPWTGVYGGLNVGHGSASGGTAESCVNTNTNTPSGCQIIPNGALSTNGFIAGGQIGYMQPLDLSFIGVSLATLPLMVGVEGDLQGTGMSGTQNVSGPFNIVGFPQNCGVCSYTANERVNWLGTIRARAGVPIDRFLVYGTAGMAVGGVSGSQTEYFGGTPGYVASNTTTLTGPTVGGGVELLLPGGLPLSAKLEGLYYDLGTLATTALPQTNIATNFNDLKTFGFHGMIIRLGINFHFGAFGGY